MNSDGYTRKERLSRRSFQSFATTAWRIAATHTASSTRVRTSHQIFDPSGMHWVRDSTSISSVYSLQERRARGTPVRGNPRNTTLRYDLSPVLRPFQNGELVDRHRMWGRT